MTTATDGATDLDGVRDAVGEPETDAVAVKEGDTDGVCVAVSASKIAIRIGCATSSARLHGSASITDNWRRTSNRQVQAPRSESGLWILSVEVLRPLISDHRDCTASQTSTARFFSWFLGSRIWVAPKPKQ